MKAKVAFLNSPYILNAPFFQQMPPLSLLYLAASMEKNGFKAKIFNLDRIYEEKGLYFFSFELNKLIKSLRNYRPQMIGITCPYSSRWPYTKRLIKIIKSKFNKIPLVTGGIHPTSFPRYCLDSSGADYVIIGEGEQTTVKLFKHILNHAKPVDVNGVAYKYDKNFFLNPKTKFIENLDALPFPTYHLININRYKKLCVNDRLLKLKGFYFPLLTSRSCPNRCSYCNNYLVHGRKWRVRSPENVIEEIEYLIKRFHIQQFNIIDDNFTLSKARTLAILKEIIRRKLDIKFITSNGLSVKVLDEEIIWHLKKAGALEICFAIESGSNRIRTKIYNKWLSEKQILKVVKACKKHQLPCKAFFMVGAPTESDYTVNQSIKLMKKIAIPASINITTPYKFTPLYDYYLQKKLIQEKDIRNGYSLENRLPIEKMKNYDKIIAWRRKLQFYNILYSWQEIIKDPGLINLNTFKRLIEGVFFPHRISKELINNILDKHLPLT